MVISSGFCRWFIGDILHIWVVAKASTFFWSGFFCPGMAPAPERPEGGLLPATCARRRCWSTRGCCRGGKPWKALDVVPNKDRIVKSYLYLVTSSYYSDDLLLSNVCFWFCVCCSSMFSFVGTPRCCNTLGMRQDVENTSITCLMYPFSSKIWSRNTLNIQIYPVVGRELRS